MHRLYDDNGGGRNQRNGGRNRSPIPVTNKNHQMDMVRHYHKNGDVGIRVMLGNCHNAMLCIFPNIRQLHFTVFDFAEIMHPVLCADGDEIHPAIIIVPFCPCRRYAVFVTENIIIFHLFHFFFVELEGVEPSSKHAARTLSTCLSLDWFSSGGWYKAIPATGLSSEISAPARGRRHLSSPFRCLGPDVGKRDFRGDSFVR